MTKNELVAQYKNELRNYKYYGLMLESVNEKLGDLWYELEGVKAIQYDRESGTYNAQLIQEHKLDLMRRINEMENQKTRLESQMSYVGDVLQSMQDEEMRNAIIDVFINGKPLRDVCKKYYISHAGLLYSMNNEIYKSVCRYYKMD